MKDTKYLGWILSAAFVGLMAASGFQKPTDKFGMVDLVRVKNESEFAKTRQNQLQDLNASQQAVIDFVRGYRLFTAEQAKRFKELGTKLKRTPAEENELAKIKSDVMASSKLYQSLQVKNPPTPAEAAQLRDFAAREGAMDETIQGWIKEFDGEMGKLSHKVDEEYFKAVDASVKELGAKQGYSVIFSRETAPYAANDLTDELIKAIAKK